MREKTNSKEAKIEDINEVRNRLTNYLNKDVYVKEIIRKDTFVEYGAKVVAVNKNIVCIKPESKLTQKAIILTDLMIGKIEINPKDQ